jgi:hypothetical protein
MALFVLLIASACVATLVTWIRQSRDLAGVSTWRRCLFLSALSINSVATLALVLLTNFPDVLKRQTFYDRPSQTASYIFFGLIAASILSAVLAFCGRRLARILLVGNSMLMSLMWFVVTASSAD